MFFKIGIRPATLLKRVFSCEIYKIFKNTSTLVAATGSKQYKTIKTYTESLCC